MVLVIYQPQEAITSDELLSQSCRIMIPKHLMRSLPSCVVIQRQKNMSWPGSRYYPSLVWRSIQASEKFSVTVRKSSSPQRNTKSFYCLQPTRGMYLHTAKSTRRCGEIFPLEVRAILSAFTSATYGRSYIRHLQMLPSPSDPSGKSDIALKYKQRNKSQQSDPLRLLFFLL